MADTQTKAKDSRARTSPLDDISPYTPREEQSIKTAQARAAAFDAAVDFLERVYVRASATAYGGRLTRWIDPEISDHEYVAARDSVISDVVQRSSLDLPTLANKRAYYKEQVQRFVPVVEEAARRWAVASLSSQTERLLLLSLATRTRAKHLHVVAKAVRARVDDRKFVLPVMSSDEAREATGESRTEGTVATRLRRLFYVYAIRTGPDLKPTEAEAFKTLFLLMVHPRGVKIVDEFAKSAETGWKYTSGLISDSLVAIVKLQGNLGNDTTLVWRFPPAISAGVASLDLAQRAGLTRFALAWGASRKGAIDEALEVAGNALLVLDLVGGPLGAAVSGILDFVFAVIGTTVSFLRDVEQDQAAAATAFAARSERLSEGSRSLGTVLQGVATFAAALAVPGAVSRITGRRTAELVKLTESAPRVSAMRDVPDPRGITTNAAKRDATEIADRAVVSNSTNLPARRVENKYELATPRSRMEQPGEARAASTRQRATNKEDALTHKPAEEVKTLKPAERLQRQQKALTGVREDFVKSLVESGATRSNVEKTADSLLKKLPKSPPKNIEELRQVVEDLMDAATKQAKLEGFVNKGNNNALGNRAHQYTEYLLDQLNIRLAGTNKKIGVFPEQFLPPKFRVKTEWVVSEVTPPRGWLGLDAVLYEDGVAALGIDLKTGRSWSGSEFRRYLQRFGLSPEDLIQHHPK